MCLYIESNRGAEGGKSPGYSLSLVAESTTGVLISAERTAGESDTTIGSSSGAGSSSASSGRPELPETVGEEGAYRLLEEIRKGGIIDSFHQPLVLMLMVVTPEDVNKVRFGVLTDQAVRTLRLLRDAFGVTFKIKEDLAESIPRTSNTNGNGKVGGIGGKSIEEQESSTEIGKTMFLSCLGTGYVNMSRKIR